MKDPAFLFYPSDFLTGTLFMNNEQIGIYIKLLCCQHQHGGIIDKTSFNSLVGENNLLRSKFIETETGYYNERLAIEMDKRNKKSNNMSETAKLVWAKRKGENTIVLQKQNKSKADVIQSINRNIDINKNKKKEFIPPKLSDVEDYFFEKGYTKEAGKKAFEYYSEADWFDSTGKKVKNWKQKMQGVWFKDENLLKAEKKTYVEPYDYGRD